MSAIGGEFFLMGILPISPPLTSSDVRIPVVMGWGEKEDQTKSEPFGSD
jgi:hypothetical protein